MGLIYFFRISIENGTKSPFGEDL